MSASDPLAPPRSSRVQYGKRARNAGIQLTTNQIKSTQSSPPPQQLPLSSPLSSPERPPPSSRRASGSGTRSLAVAEPSSAKLATRTATRSTRSSRQTSPSPVHTSSRDNSNTAAQGSAQSPPRLTRSTTGPAAQSTPPRPTPLTRAATFATSPNRPSHKARVSFSSSTKPGSPAKRLSTPAPSGAAEDPVDAAGDDEAEGDGSRSPPRRKRPKTNSNAFTAALIQKVTQQVELDTLPLHTSSPLSSLAQSPARSSPHKIVRTYSDRSRSASPTRPGSPTRSQSSPGLSVPMVGIVGATSPLRPDGGVAMVGVQGISPLKSPAKDLSSLFESFAAKTGATVLSGPLPQRKPFARTASGGLVANMAGKSSRVPSRESTPGQSISRLDIQAHRADTSKLARRISPWRRITAYSRLTTTLSFVPLAAPPPRPGCHGPNPSDPRNNTTRRAVKCGSLLATATPPPWPSPVAVPLTNRL